MTGLEPATQKVALDPVQTQPNGLAMLTGLALGRYAVRAEFPGFDPGTLKDVRVRAGTVLTREQMDAFSDDPDEMQRQLMEMAGPGAILPIDSFEGWRLRRLHSGVGPPVALSPIRGRSLRSVR